ncbi:hypothetical protein NHX12_006441 [Muraenolepis orangiensis]|uniref:Uncharacterized protein n=1 Tax=Muraenolepis orangiensis TaxID=630683 RepID=A0A9Q0DR12_9TELE|nr:hypothetical protein NHX12_006441 [Muraenolepis orangiensis]
MATGDLAFTELNHNRIRAVESAFGPAGKPLAAPGRVLVGEGRLVKRCRRRCKPKVFFLFSDVLVYGGVILSGRWYKNQKIIRLEDIQLEDLEDSMWMENHWLIRSPSKSFYVAADSPEEKRAWMDHIVDSRDRWLRAAAAAAPASTLAAAWIPDQASAVCMRCFARFTLGQRRHHCRGCGFLVCAACSRRRAVLRHIHRSDAQRVCRLCHTDRLLKQRSVEEEEDDDDYREVEQQQEEGGTMESDGDFQTEGWSSDMYLKQ